MFSFTERRVDSNLCSMSLLMGSQCKCFRMGVMWSVFRDPVSVKTRSAFCVAWRHLNCVWGSPTSKLFQSIWDKTRATATTLTPLEAGKGCTRPRVFTCAKSGTSLMRTPAAQMTVEIQENSKWPGNSGKLNVCITNQQSSWGHSLSSMAVRRSASVFCSLSFSLFWFIHHYPQVAPLNVFWSPSEQNLNHVQLGYKNHRQRSGGQLKSCGSDLKLYNENRSGPSTDPCRTPQRRGVCRNGPFQVYPLRSAQEVWSKPSEGSVMQVNIDIEAVQEQRVVYHIKRRTEVQEDKKGIIFI